VPSCEWVLDTWLLEIAQDPFNEASLRALTLLEEIKSRHRIGVDFEYRILREYFRYARADSHVGQWLRVIIGRSDKVVWRAGNVASERKNKLLNDLGFDRADLVFVGVAAEGPDKVIVSEESDYSEPVRDYLAREMQVRVLSVGEALERARDP